MKVATTPEFLQGVIDNPSVRPWVCKDGETGPIPLSAVFGDGIGLEFETGGFFFHGLGDGVYEVHTLFLPGTKDALACAKAAAHFMFCATDCSLIVTKVPEDNVPARRLTEKMGFRHDYVRESAYLRGGVLHDVRHYSLAMDDWMRCQSSARWVFEQCRALGNEAKGVRALRRHAIINDDQSALGD